MAKKHLFKDPVKHSVYGKEETFYITYKDLSDNKLFVTDTGYSKSQMEHIFSKTLDPAKYGLLKIQTSKELVEELIKGGVQSLDNFKELIKDGVKTLDDFRDFD